MINNNSIRNKLESNTSKVKIPILIKKIFSETYKDLAITAPYDDMTKIFKKVSKFYELNTYDAFIIYEYVYYYASKYQSVEKINTDKLKYDTMNEYNNIYEEAQNRYKKYSFDWRVIGAEHFIIIHFILSNFSIKSIVTDFDWIR